MVPDVTEAPKLVAVSDRPSDSLNTMCFSDGHPIFEAKGLRVLLLLLAVYWVYQINFPQDTKQQFAFIAIAVLRDVATKEIDKPILTNITLTNVLKQCNLLPSASSEQ